MKTVATIREVRSWRSSLDGALGLVPTMGFLHEGHLSLVRRAHRENAHVAASLFVNPTQFGPKEDLAAYPRDVERDKRLLEEAGCELLFAPTPAEMYPPGAETRVDVGSVARPLEGERRPGHFQGVATVVLKLFGIFEPTCAYFGRKDAQQLAVIERLVQDLDVAVHIRPCDTVREPDGLAMSSRNTYLSPAERRAAAVLFRALAAARTAWDAGERRAAVLRERLTATLATEPLARVDYAEVAPADTFAPYGDERIDRPSLLLLAVRIGAARLIDNARLEP